MSDWPGNVEAPNAPSGVADRSDESTDNVTRIDPVSGDVPTTESHDIEDDEDTSLPGIDDIPLVVSIAEKVIATSEVPAGRLVTGHTFIPDGRTTQLLGQSTRRRRVVIKASLEAADDYILIGNNPDGLEFVGYRIDDGDREPFHVSDAIYAQASGGDANVYWFAEEDAPSSE